MLYCCTKFAVTVASAAPIVNAQAPVELVQPPLQPAKREVPSGEAVSEMPAPSASVTVHAPGQAIAPPPTLPPPLPATATVRVCVLTKVAVMFFGVETVQGDV